MGNEFGHPEWVDFPREGNNWSMHYARRQWSLAKNGTLHYHELSDFDTAMLELHEKYDFLKYKIIPLEINNERKTIAFARGDLWFFFNFNAQQSFTDLKFNALAGKYELILSSDESRFGGFDNVRMPQTFFTADEINSNNITHKLSLYLPSRSAIVLQRKR